MKKNLLLFFTTIFFISNHSSANPYESSLVNNVYKNDFFKFCLPLPATWSIQQINKSIKMKSNSESNNENDDLLETYYLISANKFNPNTSNSKNNIGFGISAIKLRENPIIKTGNDFLKIEAKQWKANNNNYEFAFDKVKLGNQYFDCLSIHDPSSENCNVFRHYAVVINGYVLEINFADRCSSDINSELISVINKIDFQKATQEISEQEDKSQIKKKPFTVSSISSATFLGKGGFVNGPRFSINLNVDNNTSYKCKVKVLPYILGKYKTNEQIEVPENWFWDPSNEDKSISNAITYSNWLPNINKTIMIVSGYSFDFERTPIQLGLFIKMEIYSVDFEIKDYKLLYYDLLPLYKEKQVELGLR